MNVFILSHACVTPINQAFFAEVERRTGWNLTIVAPARWASEYGSRVLERWPAYQGALVPVPVWLSGNVPLHVYRTFFRDLLRTHAPDVVFVHHEPYGLATAQLYAANAAVRRCPIGFFTWQNIPKRYPAPFRQLEQWVYGQSAFACSGSESAADVLRQKGYTGPIDALPASLDLDLYRPYDGAPALKRELGVEEDVPLIGFMGRIVEEKGLGTLVQALDQLREQAWQVAFIGGGAYEGELRRMLTQMGLIDRCTWRAYVPHTEAPRYLSAFDVLVLPSETRPNWKEQFGRVIIEAMACGTPVLGSDSGEIPHLIEATQGGLTFAEGDAHALAARLQSLLTDPALGHRLAEHGRRAVQERFSLAAVAEAFAGTLRRATRPSTTPIQVH
ncbi:MAG: glycosyltransferase [Bacteroidota bacterium]